MMDSCEHDSGRTGPIERQEIYSLAEELLASRDEGCSWSQYMKSVNSSFLIT
jgi:hypothetical protein